MRWYGADSPKRSIPIITPFSPTHLYHDWWAAASTAIRGTPGGSTEFRCLTDCLAKYSRHGIETALGRRPSAFNLSYASRLSYTSEPVAMRTMSGFGESARM